MARSPKRTFVGAMDHDGWAVAMAVAADGTPLDRRRLTLIDAGLPSMPHHHDGQNLPLPEAVALVERVRLSAERRAEAELDALTNDLGAGLAGLALRICPPLPATVAERITNYRAMCVADWVMYRQALARAAIARGATVHWFDARQLLAEADEGLMKAAKAQFGTPWQKDHRIALAAALAARSAS